MEKKVAKIIFLDFDGVLNTEYHQRQFCRGCNLNCVKACS